MFNGVSGFDADQSFQIACHTHRGISFNIISIQSYRNITQTPEFSKSPLRRPASPGHNRIFATCSMEILRFQSLRHNDALIRCQGIPARVSNAFEQHGQKRKRVAAGHFEHLAAKIHHFCHNTDPVKRSIGGNQWANKNIFSGFHLWRLRWRPFQKSTHRAAATGPGLPASMAVGHDP